MIDDDAVRTDPAVIFQRIKDQPGSLEFVFKVRRMNEDELIVIRGQLDMFFQDEQFIPAVFVEPDFPDAEDRGFWRAVPGSGR